MLHREKNYRSKIFRSRAFTGAIKVVMNLTYFTFYRPFGSIELTSKKHALYAVDAKKLSKINLEFISKDFFTNSKSQSSPELRTPEIYGR